MQNTLNKIQDYIVIIENAVNPTLCDEIINEFSETEWKQAKTHTGNVGELRRCKNIPLSIEDIIGVNKEKREKLDASIFNIVSKCIVEYKRIHPTCLISKDSGYEILKYDAGDFYKEHIDEFTDVQRILSISIALNDDYEGGNFSFFNKTDKFKLNKGDIIIFPSNFMFPHEIEEVKSGTRYSIVTWIY